MGSLEHQWMLWDPCHPSHRNRNKRRDVCSKSQKLWAQIACKLFSHSEPKQPKTSSPSGPLPSQRSYIKNGLYFAIYDFVSLFPGPFVGTFDRTLHGLSCHGDCPAVTVNGWSATVAHVPGSTIPTTDCMGAGLPHILLYRWWYSLVLPLTLSTRKPLFCCFGLHSCSCIYVHVVRLKIHLT